MKIPSQKTKKLSLTSDAQDALNGSGFSRRSFLQSSGALIVTFSMGGILAPLDARAQFGGADAPPDSPPAGQGDFWIAIASDGRVTAHTRKKKIRQGVA